MNRRQCLRGGGVLALGALGAFGVLAGGCAGLGEPMRVSVVGLEPLPSEGLELRVAVRLRLQNAGEQAVDYDGIALELDLHDVPFATGVSDAAGTVPRFGETVVTVPVSVSALNAARQALAWAAGPNNAVDYALRGRLSRPGRLGVRFEDKGRIDLPPDLVRAS